MTERVPQAALIDTPTASGGAAAWARAMLEHVSARVM
jgi:hypothetical protein